MPSTYLWVSTTFFHSLSSVSLDSLQHYYNSWQFHYRYTWCFQYLGLSIPLTSLVEVLPYPNSATHFQGQTLDLVITDNCDASSNPDFKRLPLWPLHPLFPAHILSCASSNSPSPRATDPPTLCLSLTVQKPSLFSLAFHFLCTCLPPLLLSCFSILAGLTTAWLHPARCLPSLCLCSQKKTQNPTESITRACSAVLSLRSSFHPSFLSNLQISPYTSRQTLPPISLKKQF